MTKFTIESSALAGFAAETTEIGATELKVREKCNLVTSDKPIFHVWMQHISSLFLSKTPIPLVLIHKFLIVLHSDNKADIYINDFNELAMAQVKSSVKAGEKVYLNNISDIAALKFPDIDIKANDVVIYGLRNDWRFSLYFDFGRKINNEVLFKELGELKKEAIFYAVYASADAQINDLELEEAEALIFTEGKTDWKHIGKALEKLKVSSNLAIWTTEESIGSDDLYKMCEHYARIKQQKKMIFIFDRDEPRVMKLLKAKQKDGSDYQNWGNNVYSFYLPVPKGRSDEIHAISIEFFYSDGEIKTKNKEGRRLFLNNEFNKQSGNHVAENLNCTAKSKILRDKICIIDSEVFDKANISQALSKDAFAEAILNDEKGFENFDYSQFQSIFDIIRAILKS